MEIKQKRKLQTSWVGKHIYRRIKSTNGQQMGLRIDAAEL